MINQKRQRHQPHSPQILRTKQFQQINKSAVKSRRSSYILRFPSVLQKVDAADVRVIWRLRARVDEKCLCDSSINFMLNGFFVQSILARGLLLLHSAFFLNHSSEVF